MMTINPAKKKQSTSFADVVNTAGSVVSSVKGASDLIDKLPSISSDKGGTLTGAFTRRAETLLSDSAKRRASGFPGKG